MIIRAASFLRLALFLTAGGIAVLLPSQTGIRTVPANTDLFLRGYSVIPSPRKVALEPGDVEFGAGWKWAGVPASHIAVRTLLADLREFHHVEVGAGAADGSRTLVLSVRPGAVRTGAVPEVDAQGYILKIGDSRIEVAGNGDPGLLYGVQTLLQLLKRDARGSLSLPACTIEDWPAVQLRFLHWDTKHHQDRIETLKRFLDWSARFKINMIGFELEDKFEYPSHPVIGAPGAFTTAELQEIVNYGLDRFIQVVPQIQSPAHMAYVLKHPEFADLRADGNNYQACMCDERTYKLIFSMYDDVIRATKGVSYFHVSTDEVYYAGICARCDKPYNEENRSLRWIEFANRAREFLRARDRRMLAWVEYPVLARHIPLLPPDLINGVMSGDPEQTRLEDQRGIRQLVYTSMQGEELLFPDNFASETGSTPRGRLQDTFDTLAAGPTRGRPIGVYGAAWDDSGLHNETFWLGWATVAQYGWKPGFPSVAQHTAEFMKVYYGPAAGGMTDIFRKVQQQARFFDRSWDRVVSRVRGPAYGNSEGKGVGGVRYDRTLPAPPTPSLPALEFAPVYGGGHASLASEARRMLPENEALEHTLHEKILQADRNRHNLEVFLSIARLAGHQARLIAGLSDIEKMLQDARAANGQNEYRRAHSLLARCEARATALIDERKAVYDQLRSTWEKSRYPKGREVGGRKFVHVMDDTKDHFADRRPDLSYMIAPEESIGLEGWLTRMKDVVKKYAQAHSLPTRPDPE